MSETRPAIAAKPKLISPQIVNSAWLSLSEQQAPPDSVIKSRDDLVHFSQVYAVLKEICRIPPAERKRDRVQEIINEAKLQKTVGEEIMKLVTGPEAVNVDAKLLQIRPRLPTIVDLQWRVNVIISSSHISRALQPFIELTFVLADRDGNFRKLKMEANLQRFHALRYNVSRLLKEMQSLAGKQALQ